MEWIRVEDNLPPLQKRVLLFIELRSLNLTTIGMRAKNIEGGYHYISKGEIIKKSKINYWMPLPEPPK